MYRDYRDKDVNFFYVYKSLAHPEINNFVSPVSIDERLKHIAEFKRLTTSEIPWICDTMENEVRDGFGGAPNGEFVIDPDGKIVRKRFWSNPRTLRSDLVELVGSVDNPTSPDDVSVQFKSPEREIASGVVPRIDLPGGMMPIKTVASENEYPLFVKLRAESSRSLLQRNDGKLYLGLYLDPIHEVHWNNRASQINLEIAGPDGMVFSQTALTGPDVAEDADIDARQFLVDVKRPPGEDSFEVTASFTVCDDAETFCHTIRQSYTVYFQADRSRGSRPGVFMPGMFAKVAELDANNDGRIAGDEFPSGKSTLYLSHMDRNDDDVIDQSEIDRFMSMYNNGRGFDSPYDDGTQPDKK